MTKKFDFLLLGFSICAMFILGVSSSSYAYKFLTIMNDSKVIKTTEEWLIFLIITLFATIIWTALWLLFKVSEKRCIEHIEKKE